MELSVYFVSLSTSALLLCHGALHVWSFLPCSLLECVGALHCTAQCLYLCWNCGVSNRQDALTCGWAAIASKTGAPKWPVALYCGTCLHRAGGTSVLVCALMLGRFLCGARWVAGCTYREEAPVVGVDCDGPGCWADTWRQPHWRVHTGDVRLLLLLRVHACTQQQTGQQHRAQSAAIRACFRRSRVLTSPTMG